MSAKKVEKEESLKKNPVRASIDFFGSIKQEFKSLSWTEGKELRKLTKVIIASTFVSGFLVYFADLVVQRILNVMGLLTRIIFG